VDCNVSYEELARFVAGELDDERTREVFDHLRVCESCRKRRIALETVDAGLAEMPRIPLASRTGEEIKGKVLAHAQRSTPCECGAATAVEAESKQSVIDKAAPFAKAKRRGRFVLSGEAVNIALIVAMVSIIVIAALRSVGERANGTMTSVSENLPS